MNMPEIDEVKGLIIRLKQIKVEAFCMLKDVNNFKTVFETCRLIDMLTLPLYFFCEKYYKVKLSSIRFEPHMQVPYKRFLLNPDNITKELAIIILFTNPIDLSVDITELKEPIFNVYRYIYIEKHN